MASAPEIIVPIGTTKHDPAWKHCLMVRSSERTKLKCVYCSKQFLGGGIHRLKEHLARQKGNASCCPNVPSDVQEVMVQSLESTTTRKKRKRRDEQDCENANADDLARTLHMIPFSDMLDLSSVQVEVKQDGFSKKCQRGWRKKIGLSSQQHQLQPALNNSDMVVSLGKPSSSGEAEKDLLYMAIAKFFYEAGISLEAVNSVYFQPMLDVIASSGPQIETFSYHDFRGWILKKSLDDAKNQLDFSRASCSQTGCSILVDEWTTEKGNSIMNFSVHCPEGVTFLRSVNATGIITSPDSLSMLYQNIVEEVGVDNVVQVITSSAEGQMIAGKNLADTIPTLFWSPCASHCIDGILEDFAKLEAVSEVIGKAKTLTGIIYSNAVALNLMRKYTHGKDLVLHADTRAAVSFVTLKNMCSLRENLRAMVTSPEWVDCLLFKKSCGSIATNLICSLTFWSSCAAVVRIAEPLVQLLKLVRSCKRPTMGYIYAGLYWAKELIKKQLVKKHEYMPYWNIIQQRLGRQLHPLHAAGFFLNPLFFDSIRGDISNTLSSGLLDCIERLVTDPKVQDKIQKELNLYRSEGAADFRRKMAVRARRTLTPTDWWYTYGRCCPNLMHLAIRILSQTCSSRGCDRARIPFEQVHNQVANPLERQRMSDLAFVQYNLRMQQHRQRQKAKAFDPIALENADLVADWVLDKNALLSGDIEPTSWTEVNQPVNWVVSSDSNEDIVESFIAGLDAGMIRGAAQDMHSSDNESEEDEAHHTFG